MVRPLHGDRADVLETPIHLEGGLVTGGGGVVPGYGVEWRELRVHLQRSHRPLICELAHITASIHKSSFYASPSVVLHTSDVSDNPTKANTDEKIGYRNSRTGHMRTMHAIYDSSSKEGGGDSSA